MTNPIFTLLAQVAATSQPAAEAPFLVRMLQQGGLLVPATLFMVFLYLFVFRSKKKQDAEKKKQLESLKKGDTIETIGGLIGSVISADADTVLLKVDETANVKMKFNRRAVHRVITDDKKA